MVIITPWSTFSPKGLACATGGRGPIFMAFRGGDTPHRTGENYPPRSPWAFSLRSLAHMAAQPHTMDAVRPEGPRARFGGVGAGRGSPPPPLNLYFSLFLGLPK